MTKSTFLDERSCRQWKRCALQVQMMRAQLSICKPVLLVGGSPHFYSSRTKVDRHPLRDRARRSRFNKICHPSQRPRWQVDKEAIGLSRVQQCSSTYNPSTLFLNIFTLLAVTQSVDNLFHSFIVLCENECFLMSNLH